jgi:hypothetical protein
MRSAARQRSTRSRLPASHSPGPHSKLKDWGADSSIQFEPGCPPLTIAPIEFRREKYKLRPQPPHGGPSKLLWAICEKQVQNRLSFPMRKLWVTDFTKMELMTVILRESEDCARKSCGRKSDLRSWPYFMM